MEDNKLVCDSFNIDEDLLEELSEEDNYWERAWSFYNDVKDRDCDSITDGQRSWLIKIEEGLYKKR